MTPWEEVADAILEPRAIGPVPQEFKRTIQLDDGSTETLRIDVTDKDETHLVIAAVRQGADGHRREFGPKRFLRDDRENLSRWLANETG